MKKSSKTKKKVLVIGDSCRDVFVYCKTERLAPDIPVPVLNVVEQKENPGMAKNLERNIFSLLDDCEIVTNSDWKNITKTRYMHNASNHAFLRVDSGDKISRIDIAKVPLEKYDIIAVSDYDKGFLTEYDIKYICENHGNVFIDTKKILGDWAEKAKFIKMNNYEYSRSKGSIPKSMEDKIIRTEGDKGATFRGKLYPVNKVEVKDLSGAGDSFFAALIVKYIETGDIRESIVFANKCASKVVQHKGVTVIEKI